jgi:hypothetical protein
LIAQAYEIKFFTKNRAAQSTALQGALRAQWQKCLKFRTAFEEFLKEIN